MIWEYPVPIPILLEIQRNTYLLEQYQVVHCLVWCLMSKTPFHHTWCFHVLTQGFSLSRWVYVVNHCDIDLPNHSWTFVSSHLHSSHRPNGIQQVQRPTRGISARYPLPHCVATLNGSNSSLAAIADSQPTGMQFRPKNPGHDESE